MPMLPDQFDKVETFRRWWKDVAEFCERRQEYTDCSIIFKTVRWYQNSLEEKDEQEKMLAVAANKIPQRYQLGTTTKVHSAPLNSFWKIDDADKELYSAIKFALKGHCAEIMARVPGGRGFELLRLLALSYDPLRTTR